LTVARVEFSTAGILHERLAFVGLFSTARIIHERLAIVAHGALPGREALSGAP
jgi:hypothetical protein